MADEAENTQPEEQSQEPEAPVDADTSSAEDSAGDSGAEEAIDQAAAIVDDVAAQAEEGAGMSDDEAAAMAAAMSAISSIKNDAADAEVPEAPGAAEVASGGEGVAFESPELGGGISDAQRSDLELLSDVHMNVRIELGRTRMFVEDVLRLGDGAVVELDKLAGDPVDVYVNDRKVARGEVLVLNDNFCVRISEILDLREV